MKKFLLGFWCLGFGICSLWAVNLPELPHSYVDTTFNLPTGGQTHRVGSGDNLQAVLDAAELGDVIELEAGAEFKGSFRLRKKTGNGWIYIVSSELNQLPENKRVHLDDKEHMATLVSPNASYLGALAADYGAHHYRIAGLEFRTDNKTTVLVQTGRDGFACCKEGTAASTVEQLPSYIIFDRVLVHSATDSEALRIGIGLNGLHLAVINSFIANVKDGPDAQAILGFQGDGPYKIVNNFLESTGENVMFGGNDARIPNSVPSDIEIRGNHFYKRLDWHTQQKTGNEKWNEKNLFELKNAQRVLLSGNVFENSWSDAQRGYAIVLTPRNQGDTNPWAVVQDVTIENNLVRNVGWGFHILGEDGNGDSQQAKRILIRNNLVERVRLDYGNGYFLHAVTPNGKRPVLDLTITHNTFVYDPADAAGQRWFYLESNGQVVLQNLVYKDNITAHGHYGIDLPYASGVELANNVIFMDPDERTYATFLNGSSYPGNFKVGSIDDVGFIDPAQSNYQLKSTSPYKNAASDGKDIGVDMNALLALVDGVVQGVPHVPPPPPPTPKPPKDNPTSPTTDVELFKNLLNLTEGTPMTIRCERNVRIVSRSGDLVRELSCGGPTVDWDGKNQSGQKISAGVYILLEEKKSNRKVVVIK